MLEKYFKNSGDYFYLVFRVFVGLLFFEHGVQKLFGWLGGTAGLSISLYGLAGIIEFSCGLAIAFGFLTRLAAIITAIQILAVYFVAHLPSGIVPIMNRGELALLYFASFLVIIIYGGRKLSLEKLLWKKEVF